MRKNTFKMSVFLVAALFFVAGCATTRARKSEPLADQNTQVAELQRQLQEKDQQIQDLQYQLTSSQQSIGGNYTSGSRSDRSSIIRVSGVSVSDVQKALVRAGYDPGPVDGNAGKKTKSAIKQFQRQHSLTADGVVGQKTWDRLR